MAWNILCLWKLPKSPSICPEWAGLATPSQKGKIKGKATSRSQLPGSPPQQLHREVHFGGLFEVECDSLIPVTQPSSLQGAVGVPYLSPINLIAEGRGAKWAAHTSHLCLQGIHYLQASLKCPQHSRQTVTSSPLSSKPFPILYLSCPFLIFRASVPLLWTWSNMCLYTLILTLRLLTSLTTRTYYLELYITLQTIRKPVSYTLIEF